MVQKTSRGICLVPFGCAVLQAHLKERETGHQTDSKVGSDAHKILAKLPDQRFLGSSVWGLFLLRMKGIAIV